MGARYYDSTIGRFTQPEPAWSNPMFNSMGGRNLLVARAYSTGAAVGQEITPMPRGYYRPAAEYNWYSYAGNDPVNRNDVSGYWDWGKVGRVAWASHDAVIIALGGAVAGAGLIALGVALPVAFGPPGLVGSAFFVPAGAGVWGLTWYLAYLQIKEAWEDVP